MANSDEHSSSLDRLSPAVDADWTAAEPVRRTLHNCRSAGSDDSDDVSSGVGSSGVTDAPRHQFRHRPHHQSYNPQQAQPYRSSTSGRRRKHHQHANDGQRQSMGAELDLLNGGGNSSGGYPQLGLTSAVNDVDPRLLMMSDRGIRSSTAFSNRNSRYRSGTDSVDSARTSAENHYSRISDDTLPLPSHSVASRPNIFLPPPPPVEQHHVFPPTLPRRTNTSGTQTIDRLVPAASTTTLPMGGPDHPLDVASDQWATHEDQRQPQQQYLLQTPFGCVFAPTPPPTSSTAVLQPGHVISPMSQFPRTIPRPAGAPAPATGGVDSRDTSTAGGEFLVELFARPAGGVMVDRSTPAGSGWSATPGGQSNSRGPRTDRVGAMLPIYPTATPASGSRSYKEQTSKRTDSGSVSKHFASIAGCKVKSQLERRCSWRCIAIALMILALILIALVAYFTAMKALNLSWNLEQPLYSIDGSDATLSPSRDHFHSKYPLQPLPTSHPAVDQYQVGSRSRRLLGPNQFWKLTFYLRDSKTLRFNASISSPPPASGSDHVTSGSSGNEAAIGFYGRRGLPPSHVQYDFFYVADVSSHVVGPARTEEQRRKRSVTASNAADDAVETIFVQYFDSGLWYLFIYNDSPQQEEIEFDMAEHKQAVSNTCKNNCHGHGYCVDGRCRCWQGFTGPDCAETSCRPLCNGRGHYVNGTCQCSGGWRGSECQFPFIECVDPTCGGGNGQCVDGQCVCAAGFRGVNCTEDHCLVRCVHGRCRGETCSCDDGWEGEACDTRQCDRRCVLHGTCLNGTCQCQPGWNGRHCSLDGCPSSCNGHGTCRRQLSGDWNCACDEGWTGAGCSVAMETVCDGNVDDDEDGATDCLDPDCCSSPVCRNNANCQTSPDPMEILLRKQPPSSTASFYDRMKFLIEDESVQSYATISSFSSSQVSVIRGRVVGVDGIGLTGVRVSIVTQPLYGFTLTRDLGQFDILVNGGGSVTVMFQRPPFRIRQVTVMVPWNRMVTMETVMLFIEGRANSSVATATESCVTAVAHDYKRMRPTVLSTWHHTQLGACPSRSTVIPESQVVKQSLPIPGTDVFLVYHSSTAPGYMSTIMIQLTPDAVAENLAVIYLKVTIEGVVFEKTFEAEPSLKYKFAWDRRNAYNQKVYGIVFANVAVGYQYDECRHIFWESRSATLSGYDISSSEIGGWNLNIHHTYNYQEGILHKGDGTNVFLKQRRRRMSTILGTGRTRRLDCRGCDGKAEEAHLMAPVALASGRDGSLYVGDYNFIRRLSANRDEVTSILQLNMSEVPYKYYMSVSPLDGKLYISDHRSLRIFRVKTMGSVRDLTQNAEVVAGTGEQCVPGDPARCGDGGAAVSAQLFYPKGLAINKDGIIYVADGANIRSIDTSGVINTVVGSQGPLRYWQPFPCDGLVSSDEVMLHWPSALAVNPVDDTLHILDSSMVLKLTKERNVFPVAGRANHCPLSMRDITSQLLLDREATAPRLATDLPLVRPQHIAFDPAGNLYIVEEGGTAAATATAAESGTRAANRIRMVDTSGVLSDYVGGMSQSCDCRPAAAGSGLARGCQCQTQDGVSSTSSQTSTSIVEPRLGAPTAVTVTPDGVVHVADVGNLRVHSIVVGLPAADRISGQYDVIDDSVQEIYTFNRFGQHVSTRNVLTNAAIYNFTYNVNSYYSKLIRVSDASSTPLPGGSTSASAAGTGNSIVIRRDYRLMAQDITPPGGAELRCKLTMDNMGQLAAFTTLFDNVTTKFEYITNTGLITSREESGTGQIYRYEYDRHGRISSVINPAGSRTRFDTDVDRSGAVVRVAWNNDVGNRLQQGGSSAMATNGNLLTIVHDQYRFKASQHSDGSLTLEYPFQMAVALETIPHPFLGSEYHLLAKRQIVLPNGLSHQFEWRYFQRPEGQSRKTKTSDRVVGRQMKVNGDTILTFEYDRINRSETVFDHQHDDLLTFYYDVSGRVIQISPSPRSLHGLQISYDPQGHITKWIRGSVNHTLSYDDKGRMTERQFGPRSVYKYVYRNGSKPTEVVMPSGKTYKLEYDKNDNLMAVVSPTSARHSFARVVSPGIDRDVYWLPPVSSVASSPREALIVDRDASGYPVRTTLPSGSRRTVHRYGTLGRLSLTAFDQTDIEYLYNPESAKLIAIQTVDVVTGNVTSKLSYGEPTEALITAHNVSWFDELGLATARFRYSYDNHFRVVATDATIAGIGLPTCQYRFSSETGRVQQIGDFVFLSGPTQNGRRTQARDSFIEISREVDGHGRETDVSYTFNSYAVFSLEVKYDALGRVQLWRRSVGSSDIRQVEYLYDLDSRVTEVVINGQSTWRYEINGDGDVTSSSLHGNVRLVATGARGQTLQSANGKKYTYDDNGFIVQRDDEKFEWNSLGRLVKSYTTSSSGDCVTSYHYDPLNRLAAILSQRTNSSDVAHSREVFQQFFYADLDHPNRITNAYDHVTQTAVEFLYDSDEHLFAFRRNGAEIFYVANDPHSSPIVVFSSSGGVVKQTSYDPLGAILSDDSKLEFPLLISYRGSVWDPVAKILFFDAGAKTYDPELGHWMSPDFGKFFDSKLFERNLIERPFETVHLYQTGFLAHQFLAPTTFPLTDLSHWLNAVDYNYNSLVPSVSFNGDIRGGFDGMTVKLMSDSVPDTSAFRCAFDRDSQTFDSSSRLSARSLVTAPNNVSGVWIASSSRASSSSFAPHLYLSDLSIKISMDEYGRLNVGVRQVDGVKSDWKQLLANLLNGSRPVGVGYLLRDQRAFDIYLRDGDVGRVDDELRAAGLDPDRGGTVRLETGGSSSSSSETVNVTVSRHHSQRRIRQNSGSRGGGFVDVFVSSPVALLQVRYTSQSSSPVDSDNSSSWVVRAVKSSTVESVWKWAQKVASENPVSGGESPLPSSSLLKLDQFNIRLTGRQHQELISTGRIVGFKAKHIRNPVRWPEFADDPLNIRLVESADSGDETND